MKKWIVGRDYAVHNVHYTVLEMLTRKGRGKLLAEELIKGNTVVEIGAGSTPQEHLFQYQPKAYFCVEPTIRQKWNLPSFVQYINEFSAPEMCDAVSFLEKLTDNSVTALSSAVFDPTILRNPEYAREVVRLLYQKTIPRGLSLHTVVGNYRNMFFDEGFELEYCQSMNKKRFLEEDLHAALPTFFRKKV